MEVTVVCPSLTFSPLRPNSASPVTICLAPVARKHKKVRQGRFKVATSETHLKDDQERSRRR
jgi:hypothetical protein